MPTRKRRSTLEAGPRSRDEALLAATEVTHRAKVLAEAHEFELAAAWGEAHPGDDAPALADHPLFEANVLFGDRPLEVAGYGAPTVSEFAITEFAVAVGTTSTGGRKLIGSAIETKHRLPRLWDRVMAGEVQVWKARRVAEHTIALPPQAAAQVDTILAPIAHTCSFAEIERVANAAAKEADADNEEDERASTGPFLRVGLDDAKHNHGYVPIEGLLDLDDALALEAAIKAKAHALLDEHPTLDLDARRAMALGLFADGSGERELVIYTHHDTRAPHGIVGVEGASSTGSTITVEQLAEWCQKGNTRVSIRPVLDLAVELTADSYAPTARMREQVILTCPTCVFPGCGKSARTCDLDHIQPWPLGPTTSSNLAPLCRLHHRLKTHGYWTYTRPTLTTFVWTSPMGRTYTNDLTHKRRRTH
ncbi:HNH endonuclease signature motif containing protein [Nocardioides conyzicola]|uniref:HNH nuclease domain-containing protein n=1 Tax=Nocardioides conyzicola TaxID=1651781 RepID=A0ABP8WVH3_9ACTN